MSHNRRRVVVTGMGTVNPLGNSADAFWDSLLAGRSGIEPITLFDASRFPVRIGGEVRDLPAFPSAGTRDRKVHLGLLAIEQAVAGAGIGHLCAAALHVGVSLETFFLQDMTAVAGAGNLGQALLKSLAGSKLTHDLQTPLDRLASDAAARHGLSGPRFTNCSACAAGAQAIGDAFHDIQDGQADIAITGGADSMLNPLGLGGFSLLRILSAENDQPTRACRPFDATRQGTVLGEGAAFLVLEELRHAQARSARIHAEIIGYGSSMDAYRISDPDPAGLGAVVAMRAALADARLRPEQIDCLSAHGTGTPKNDVTETVAIKEVLGAHAGRIPVHSVKSMTGHLIAASGAVEALAAVLTLERRAIPPTINLDRPDPACDLDYVPWTSRPFAGETVLSNSFGFGGQNAVLIFRRWAT